MEEKLDGKESVPASEDLFEVSVDGVYLLAARCNDCQTYFFPRYHAQHRPGCPRRNIENVILGTKGVLTSFTIQHYMCPPPFKAQGDISPYGIGLVRFPEGIEVAGLIAQSNLEKLEVGREMETVAYTLYQDEEGRDVLTWAFKATK